MTPPLLREGDGWVADRLGRRDRAVGRNLREAGRGSAARRRARRRTAPQRRSLLSQHVVRALGVRERRLAHRAASAKPRRRAFGGTLRRSRARAGDRRRRAAALANGARDGSARAQGGRAQRRAPVHRRRRIRRFVRRRNASAKRRRTRPARFDGVERIAFVWDGIDVRGGARRPRDGGSSPPAEKRVSAFVSRRTSQRARRGSAGLAAARRRRSTPRAIFEAAARAGKLAALSLFGANPVLHHPGGAGCGPRRARQRAVRRGQRSLHDRDGGARDARAAGARALREERPRLRSHRRPAAVAPASTARRRPLSDGEMLVALADALGYRSARAGRVARTRPSPPRRRRRTASAIPRSPARPLRRRRRRDAAPRDCGRSVSPARHARARRRASRTAARPSATLSPRPPPRPASPPARRVDLARERRRSTT